MSIARARYLLVRKLREAVKIILSAGSISDKLMARNIEAAYRNQSKIISQFVRTADTAVVIHLYYTDAWPSLQNSLKKLNITFDLYISLPTHNEQYKKEILRSFPRACVVITPNRGRDVLPFIKITNMFSGKGYKYILKLHSKKSTHRSDGAKWFSDILEALLPQDEKVLDKLMLILRKENTGIVGPKDQYFQLTVNFEANGVYLTRILNSIYHDSLKVYDTLQLRRADYGFFAGTMFWARMDALMPILEKAYPVSRFSPEYGQIDGTFAHSLERAFCLVPEIDGKNMYEIGRTGIRSVEYDSGHIPEWSDVYKGPA